MTKRQHGINLFISNSLEEFVKRYPHFFYNSNLFADDQIIIVQNENIANWLKTSLADHHGISMQVTCMMPEKAFRKVISHFLDPAKLLYLDEMRMLLEKLIGQLPPLHPVAKFIQNSAPSNKAKVKRIFEIAKRLSVSLHQYNYDVLDLPLSWMEGKSLQMVPPSGDSKFRALSWASLEKWQKEFWQKLFLDNGNRRDEHNEGKNACLLQLEKDIRGLNPSSPLPRITVFGSAFLSAVHTRLLARFAHFTEINQCLFSPLLLNKKNEQLNGGLSPIAKEWGRILVDNYTFLRDHAHVSVQTNYLTFPQKDVLSIIKNILANSIPKDMSLSVNSNQSPGANPCTDIDFSTFKIVGCPGREREIEVLKNKIITLLEKDINLKLHEIGVMAFDINDYRFFVESTFSKSTEHPHIPHNIVDLNYDSNNALLNAYQNILDLADSSFHLDEVERLLHNSYIRAKLNLSEEKVEEFIALAKKLNIVWGIDHQHRKRLRKGGGEHNTWHQAFSRILWGHYYQKDHGEEEIFLECHPRKQNEKNFFSAAYSILDRESEEMVIKVILFLNDLYFDTRILEDLDLTMTGWIDFSRDIINQYLISITPFPSIPESKKVLDEKRLSAIFAQMLEMAKKANDPLINFQSFKLNWEEQISKKSVQRGAYLTEGVTFSSLRPMRSIPFKHIFLLGMNEKNFPRESMTSPIDLRTFIPPAFLKQSLNYNETHLDSFSFLETLFCAQTSVEIFYHHKDLLNHNPLQPTVLAWQIVDSLSEFFSMPAEFIKDNIHEIHPLHNYDSIYFSPSSKLKNYSNEDYQAALALHKLKSHPTTNPNAHVYLERTHHFKPLQSTTKMDIAEKQLSRMETFFDLEDLLSLFTKPASLFFRQGLEANIHHQSRAIEEREKTEILQWHWITYLSNMPFRDVEFKDFIENLKEKGFITGNHLDERKRKKAETLTRACRRAFKELELINCHKHTYRLFPDSKHFIKSSTIYQHDQISHLPKQELLFIPPLSPSLSDIENKDIFITGDIELYGDKFFGNGKKYEENALPDLKCYLQSLIFSFSQGRGGSEENDVKGHTLVTFNPHWKRKATATKLFLSPKQAETILCKWIELYYQHLQNPMPLYFSAISKRIKNFNENKKSFLSQSEELEKEVKKEVKDNFNTLNMIDSKKNITSQEKYRFEMLFESFQSPHLPWEKISVIFDPLMR